MSNWETVERFLAEVDEGSVSRRAFLSRLTAAGLAASAAGPLLAACGGSSSATGTKKKVSMRFGYTATQGNPVAQGFEKFATLVQQRSNSDINVQTFCCNQLGNDQELVQAAQSGAIQIGDSSNNNLDQFTSSMMVLELPYLIKSRTAYRKFWTGSLSNDIRSQFEQKLGIKILMVMDAAGFRSIETSGAPVRTPTDLHGMKLRVANTPIEVATFKTWGANPVPMAYNQVLTAMQQKTVDGEVLQPVWFYSDKHYEVGKYLSDIHYIMLSHIAVINLSYFRSLPKDYQDLLTAAAKDAEDYEWGVAGTESDQAIAKLKSMAGFTYYTPTASELQQWEATSRPVWDQFQDKVGADLLKKVEALS